MSAELKTVIEELGRTFEAFKGEHKTQIDELRKGVKDALQEEKIVSINKKLDDLQAKKDALDLAAKAEQKRVDEIEKKLNRPLVGAEKDADKVEMQALSDFNVETKAIARSRSLPAPADIDLDGFRAYKSAFWNWARKGSDMTQLSDVERKAMSVGSEADGGFLIPTDSSGRVTTKLYELFPLRARMNVQQTSSDAIEGIEDLGEADSGWVGETAARSDTNTPQVGKYRIPVHEIYASPKATQKIIDDSATNIEAWLEGKVSDRFARQESAAFVAGTGASRPRGFTTYATAATADATRAWGTFEHIMSGASADFASSSPADVLFSLIAAFKTGYLLRSAWVTRREVIAKVRKLKEATTNAYMWQPGLQAGQPSQLLGFPVEISQDMPTLAADSLSLALGDLNATYTIVERIGLRVLRDPYTDKPYVKFYTTRRVGGGAVNFEALKFIKFNT